MLINFSRKRIIFIVIGISCLFICIIYFLLFYNRVIPKNQMIDSFNRNYDKFENVQQYIEKDDGNFYLDYSNGKLTVKNNGTVLNVDKLPIKNELLYLVHKLHISNIDEYQGTIHFATYSGAYYYEQGVVYLKKSAEGNYGSGTEYIKNDWYYYWVQH